jgi:putative Holliday junction resolvase
LSELPGGVLLSLDLGAVRVGVAACDAERILAYPVATWAADEQLAQQVVGLVAELGAVGIVVGYPVTLSGQPGLAAGQVEQRAYELAGAVEVPVWLVDERLTTAQAGRRLREAGRSAKSARRVIDAQAAVGILDTALRALADGRPVGRRVV